MNNSTVNWTTAALVVGVLGGSGYALYKAGYIGNPFEKFDHMDRQQLDQLDLGGPVACMYDDWTRIQTCRDRHMFAAKWGEQMMEWGVKRVDDMLPTFFRIWMGRHGTLAADLEDRLRYLNDESKAEDHTEDVMSDSPLEVEMRRKRLEALIWKTYAPELFKGIELQC